VAIVTRTPAKRVVQPTSTSMVPTMSTRHCFANPIRTSGRRAAFAAATTWVTPYSPDERRAVGEYPTRHPAARRIAALDRRAQTARCRHRPVALVPVRVTPTVSTPRLPRSGTRRVHPVRLDDVRFSSNESRDSTACPPNEGEHSQSWTRVPMTTTTESRRAGPGCQVTGRESWKRPRIRPKSRWFAAPPPTHLPPPPPTPPPPAPD